MSEREHAAEALKALVEKYDFHIDTLSKYLSLPVEQMENILRQGNLDFLPEKCRFQVFTKIYFLYGSAAEDKDLKLNAFLEVLLSYHKLSENAVAEMAGVTAEDIRKIRAGLTEEVDMEARYKTAVTVMSLRFFLKDCEPPAV